MNSPDPSRLNSSVDSTTIEGLRQAEAYLRFLYQVSLDLDQLRDIDQSMTALSEKIGAFLGLSAIAFAELKEQAQIGVINYDWHQADMPSFLGTYRMAEFVSPQVLQQCQAGEPVIIRDVFADSRTDGEQYAAFNIGSFVSMPLIRDGEWRFLLVVYRKQAYDWGQREIDLLNELTSRIWTRLESARAEEALQETNRRKDEFLAMLAHELRNPMATIHSGLQILSLTGSIDQPTSPTLAMMHRQTQQLVHLVDDLLDVSRISQGKIELKQQPLSLVDVVDQAAESVQSLYQQQGRHLLLNLPSAPIYVEGDGPRLTQVVVNLLTNGARYTEENGQVWLNLSHQAGPSMARPGEARPEAVIEVRDNGIGLAADQLESIFELFVQVDNSVARSKGGLGLGLTLVKRLIELHGGRIEAQSEGVGKGSRFLIYLPTVNTAPEQPQDNAPSSPLRASTQRILIVDDNADAALTLSMLLKLKGYDVHTRHSGQEAIQAGEALRPAVIVCDIGMPGMDGYEAARLIRQQFWGANVLLIALTGYGQDEDKQRTQAAGFDGHLVKPVNLEALIGLIAEGVPKGLKVDSKSGPSSADGQLKALQATFDQLQIAVPQRSEHLLQLTHDLRGSLGIVSNAVSFLLMPIDEVERSQLLAMLRRNLVSVQSLLDQLSRIAQHQ